MRLKSADGPLSVHNGNNDILNSPKRINTIQNSNVTTQFLRTTTTTSDVIDLNTFNNVDNAAQDKVVQWCNSAVQQAKKRELTNNANNRNQLLNINNTLAAPLRTTRHGTASSIYSESSPDDSLLDFEEAHQQSGSSAETSPQDEERGFDVSDSESSEEGNISNKGTIQRRGIVNPNYPGFQHLAHTLDYSIKVSSDTDFTDDDFDCESLHHHTDVNNINNNNNNNNNDDTADFPIDHIDSVNRLDSIENIQKVFYDKPVVFNIDDSLETLENQNICDSESSSHSIQVSDDDVHLNIKLEEKCLSQSATHENIVGDFGKEIEQELGRISLENQNPIEPESYQSIFDIPYELPPLERALIQELKEAVEKLVVISDWQPSATKYNIQPNIEEPFDKLSPSKQIRTPEVLEDCTVVQEQSELLDKEDPQENSEIIPETVESDPKNLQLDEDVLIASENISKPKIDSGIMMENCVPTNFPSIKTILEDSGPTEVLQDAFLSGAKESVILDSNLNVHETKMETDECTAKVLVRKDSNRELEEIECQIKKIKSDSSLFQFDDLEKFCKEDVTKDYKEKEDDSAVVPRKKEKMDYYVKKRRDYNQQFGSLITFPRREMTNRNRDPLNRRAVPMGRDKKRSSPEILGGFDVYNIETAMPKIDLEAIENHLRAAREEERRRRTDREEIRRRLAMGSEDDYYTDRPGRKPSLQARLQSGMNLQICFMNETVSDNESPTSDAEFPMTNSKLTKSSPKKNGNFEELPAVPAAPIRPATLSIGQPLLHPINEPMNETDFFARQARLQTEARMALAQAKEMARMQMEIEKQRQKKSPITEMVRHSLEKVGIPFPEEKRRLSRQILTEMNVAQLQVIVNDLHTQIETLNENLVKFLMDRDDLHMEQDSMLVDIEDLTRYLGAKEQVFKEQTLAPTQNNNMPPPSPAPSSPLAALNSSVKPHLHRIASLVKK